VSDIRSWPKRTPHMSAFDPKRTSLVATHMSAFGGKADMGKLYSNSPQIRTPRTALIAHIVR